jgi:hypothetical protein
VYTSVATATATATVFRLPFKKQKQKTDIDFDKTLVSVVPVYKQREYLVSLKSKEKREISSSLPSPFSSSSPFGGCRFNHPKLSRKALPLCWG